MASGYSMGQGSSTPWSVGIPTRTRASLVAQTVKNLPATWEIWVRSLGPEDLLEKEIVTHFSILALRIPWTEEPGRLSSTGSQKSNMT